MGVPDYKTRIDGERGDFKISIEWSFKAGPDGVVVEEVFGNAPPVSFGPMHPSIVPAFVLERQQFVSKAMQKTIERVKLNLFET